MPHLAKHKFPYRQARSQKGIRSMSHTICRVGPIQRMKQSAMLLILNVAWQILRLLWKAMLPIDHYAASVKKHFILFVCFGFKKTTIAKIVTKVSQCDTGTLFEELFQSQEMAKAQTGPTYRERDLVKHVDNTS